MERALNAILDRLPALRLDPEHAPAADARLQGADATHLAVRF